MNASRRKPRTSRDIERTYTRTQFVAKLRRFADAIEQRRPFAIQVGGERLHISALAKFNIEHEREDGAHELEFQLRWRDEPQVERRATRTRQK